MKPLNFQLCHIMKLGLNLGRGVELEPSVLLDVDVRDVEQYFETLPSHARPTQGGWGISVYERYSLCIAIIENSPSIDAPALRLTGGGSGLEIVDGRHRLQALMDLGYTAIKIAVPQRQAERITALLLRSRESVAVGGYSPRTWGS